MIDIKDDYTKQVEEDLNFFDIKLKVLRAEYNQYFIGARKNLPDFTEAEIRKIIKKYAGDKQLKGMLRFRLFNLMARYTTLREFWMRKIRFLQDGTQIGTRAHLKQGDGSPFKPPTPRATDEIAKKGQQRVIQDPKKQQVDIRMLYLSYVQAVRSSTGDEGRLPFEKFKQQIVSKVTTLKLQKSCDAVQFRITTEEGKVRLKAKAVVIEKKKA